MRIAKQNPDGGSVAGRRAAPDRVISTVDPDPGTRTRPRRGARTGQGHVVVEPDTGIVTACAVTKASGEGSSDATAGAVLLATDPTVPER